MLLHRDHLLKDAAALVGAAVAAADLAVLGGLAVLASLAAPAAVAIPCLPVVFGLVAADAVEKVRVMTFSGLLLA